ncbi:MAG: glycerate kinase, partial [Bacteroidales bacterium]|nr:glycerate kinase [Candidatus Colicola faecequi]
MKKIVIASDSFKGSLSSKEVARAAAEGIREALGEEVEIVEVQVADGGEGTSAALAEQLGGEMQTVVVCDPLFRPVEAHYAIVVADGKRTAVMEMAEASGLTLIPTWVRNPI